MLYPENFEEKIEFDQIRNYISSYCLSDLGKDELNKMNFLCDNNLIIIRIKQTLEFVDILKNEECPDLIMYDLRSNITRIRINDSYLSIKELFDLYRILGTLANIIQHLNKLNETNTYKYPNLQLLTIDIRCFPEIYNCIEKIINDYGEIKNTASQELDRIRKDKSAAERNVSRLLQAIVKKAQDEGIIDSNTNPALRDGRLVIPIAPAYKRKINGIIHDESDSGKTVYVEPTQVVEANNLITELENKERKEIIKILKNITSTIRPYIDFLLQSFTFLGEVDFIRAKAKFAILTESKLPHLEPTTLLQWNHAVHPLLKIFVERKASVTQDVVPLDICLSKPSQRILIISGPNAGGKSVCLKTVGLLQYMLQCGMPIPLGEDSKCGIFNDLFISIGDEQSLENELSTFSSFLYNMKTMMKCSNDNSLLLIDEFGGGTEPMIGGALAQAILKKFNNNKVFGIITTHFQNLKQYAQETEGIVNGAMLYDRGEMRPLFQLRIGTPGSSFAVEIARKIGIPKDVIDEASDIVGSDYIKSDKYIQDIIRDKRYWENKRKEIHQKEKRMEMLVSQYEADIKKIKEEKRKVIEKAKEEAKALLDKSNAVIERTIKEIKEAQAERNQTKILRQELNDFKKDIALTPADELDLYIQRKVEKINVRKKRKTDNKINNINKELDSAAANHSKKSEANIVLKEGDYVRMKNQPTIGRIIKIGNGKEALVAFGVIQMNVKVEQLELSVPPKDEKRASTFISKETTDNIRETTLTFKTEIDIRGMRVDEALQTIKYYMDDALVASVSRVRILHGTGSGILRKVIREYLLSLPNVTSTYDEHPQFGGAGITIVNLEN
jgi:DNA mismatch repair protein MutS2